DGQLRPSRTSLDHARRRRILAQTFGPGAADATRCADALVSLLLPRPIQVPLSDRSARAASHWLAGFITLADWLGSDTRHFPYTAPAHDLATCWAARQEVGWTAVRDAGLTAARPALPKDFAALTGLPRPSPLQEWAAKVSLPPGPCLIVIEDVTGAGKT